MILQPFSIKQKVIENRKPTTDNFDIFLKEMKEQFKKQINFSSDAAAEKLYYELNRKALVGEGEAVAFFYQEIEKYLRKFPFNGAIPTAYRSTIEGLFHEWKGFSTSYSWFTNVEYAESSGLQIIGQNIFYNNKGKFIPYEHRMPSLDRVDQLKRSLLTADDLASISKEKPTEEFKMNDPLWPGRFIRFALWVYPRTWEEFPTISARRQVIEYLSFEEQEGTGSIPHEALIFIRNLFLLNRNTIVAGPVGSGKTTLANTIVGEQLQRASEANICLGCVMIERHPESVLPYHFPQHRIIPVMAKNEELMNVGIESLRHDPNILFMTEMRYHEWEFYIWAGSKGYDNIIGSFHTKDAEDIPYQAAQAVYTNVGGNLKGHLISALQSCELVVIMESNPQGGKCVTRISEIVFDEIENNVYANDLMRFDVDTQSYTYYDGITDKMQLKMKIANASAFELMYSNLQSLHKKRPMKDPIVVSKRSKVVLA
jgi:pilus assembly protein CpaF